MPHKKYVNATLRSGFLRLCTLIFSNTDSLPHRIKMAELKAIMLCDLCEDEPKNQAEKICRQCGVSYCNSCFQMFHPLRGPFAKHDIQSTRDHGGVKEAIGSTTPSCPDHNGKELDMFCVRCQRPICYLCDRIGGHHEHEVCDIDTACFSRKVRCACATRVGARVYLTLFFACNRKPGPQTRVTYCTYCSVFLRYL